MTSLRRNPLLALRRSFSIAHVACAGDTDGPQPMSRYGDRRTALAKACAEVLSAMPSAPRFFLDNGTLLGLWRNKELIDSDDDFDFGLLVHEVEFSTSWVVTFQKEFQARFEVDFPQYRSRVVDTYANKIEVFDPSAGSFPLRGARYEGARYHHVSVDFQLHVEEAEAMVEDEPILITEGEVVTGRGVTIMHTDFEARGVAPRGAYEPFGSIRFADTDWPVPFQQEVYLSFLYGYLGMGAEFDVHSRLYRLKLIAESSYRGQAVAPLRVYTDMCADLFHSGHVNYLRQCCDVAGNVDVHLIVGIHSDATIEGYKRAPVCTMEERISVVECCTYVCEVLADAPLQVTADFMKEHAIDFVVHGTEVPELERRAMYDYPITQGRYAEVPRTGGISTTDIIDRIASRLAVEVKEDEHALPSERKPAAVVVKELREKQKAKTKN